MSIPPARRPPRFVVNDLVIKEDNCNLSCSYCLTGQSLFKEEHALQKIFDPPRPSTCEPGTELGLRLRAVLRGTAAHEIPVLKISGGEVLLIRGIMDFIEEASGLHEKVVILTNGSLVTESRLERLKALGNIVLQISLDATRYPGNSYRVPSEQAHESLMERIQPVLASGIPTEIYTVLNDRSIETLGETVEDLAVYADHVTIFPFPVRGPWRQRFLPRPEQHLRLREVIDRAESYGRLLPGTHYLERLWRFFQEGGRNFRCHLPRVAFTSFDDGTLTSCPNIWFNRIEGALSQPAEEIFSRLESAPFRKLLLSSRPRIEACRSCFTPWDPISAYIEGELTLEDVECIPMYQGERTRMRLEEIRSSYLAGDRCA